MKMTLRNILIVPVVAVSVGLLSEKPGEAQAPRGGARPGGAAPAAQRNPCATPANAIVAENCKPGNPETDWDTNSWGDLSIQGFATDMSVNHGQSISFKVKTDATAY